MTWPLRVAVWCLYALSAFQLLIAILLYLNWQQTVDGFTGRPFAPTPEAAESAAAGTLGLHALVALLYLWLAWKVGARRRWARLVATLLLAVNIVGGVVTMFTLSDQTPLNPVGIVLALAAVIFLWVPKFTPAVVPRH